MEISADVKTFGHGEATCAIRYFRRSPTMNEAQLGMINQKGIVALALAACCSAAIHAQIESGTTAPTFETTTLTGETFSLQSELDAGRSVVIHFMSTWSGVSWDYHSSGSLQDFYELFGPAEADLVSVLLVEGDPDTSSELLEGVGADTWGDWTEGISYPIAEDPGLAALYEVNYYPTLFKICPDGIVHEIYMLDFNELMDQVLVDCSNEVQGVLPQIVAYTGTESTCDTADVRLTVANYGMEPLTSAAFEVSSNGTSVGVFPWEGEIGAYGMEDITVTELELIGDTEIEVSLTEGNGVALEDSLVAFVETAVEVTTWWNIDLLTDCYPEETTWTVTDEDGVVVESGGPYTDQVQTLIEVEFGLPATGCYTFTLEDTFGDGMHGSQWGDCPGDGYCVVTTAEGDIYNYDGSYDFETEAKAANAAVVSVNEQQTGTRRLSVFPNPARTSAQVLAEGFAGKAVSLQVMDALGHLVIAQDLGIVGSESMQAPLDLTHIESGLYTVRLRAGDQLSTTRLVVYR